jgi:hypothetical protein
VACAPPRGAPDGQAGACEAQGGAQGGPIPEAVPGTTDKRRDPRPARDALLALVLAALIACLLAGTASAGPVATRVVRATGTIVPIPAAIPHEAGDMVDRRIIPDLRWIARRFPIFVTDGYSGPLPDGEHAGCRGCHVKGSDHYNGLAVDIVPLQWSGKCDRNWRGITRLARWAEPRQNRPAPPFRWVGYDGDSGHGCGDHLHLSWEHAPARNFRLAEWVEVFPVRRQDLTPHSAPGANRGGPAGGAQTGPQNPEPAGESQPSPAQGGISRIQTGGVSPRGD